MVVIVVFGDEVVDVVALGLPWVGAVFGAAPFACAPFGEAETGAAVKDRMVATLIKRLRSRMLVSSGSRRGKPVASGPVRLSC